MVFTSEYGSNFRTPSPNFRRPGSLPPPPVIDERLRRSIHGMRNGSIVLCSGILGGECGPGAFLGVWEDVGGRFGMGMNDRCIARDITYETLYFFLLLPPQWLLQFSVPLAFRNQDISSLWKLCQPKIETVKFPASAKNNPARNISIWIRSCR